MWCDDEIVRLCNVSDMNDCWCGGECVIACDGDELSEYELFDESCVVEYDDEKPVEGENEDDNDDCEGE